MAKHRPIRIQFPLAGLNRGAAYRQQAPFTSPDLLNVRPRTTRDGRERGGSRPGLIQSHVDDIGGAVRMLAPMVIAMGDDFTTFSDTFSGLSMAAAWTLPGWATDMPSILPPAFASIDTDTAEGEAVLSALPIDTSLAYTVEALLVPWEGAWHGKYRLYLRLDNTTPAIGTSGVMVELVQTGTSGAYTGTMTSTIGGVTTTYTLTPGTITPRPGWLSATVSTNTITVRWNGATLLTQAVSAHVGERVGFGLECTVDGGLCLANVFRVQYYSTGSVETLRSLLVASADGSLFKEGPYGRLTAVSSSLTVRDDVPLESAQSGQKLYIADYGDLTVEGDDGTVATTSLDAPSVSDWTAHGIDAHDMVVVISNAAGGAVDGTYKIQSIAAGSLTLTASAGTGTCSYRIERAPKVYDPVANTIVLMYATTGQVPTGNPLICRYLDRIVLAGAEIAPHVWYMSRVGDELDWDYSQTDSQRAVAGTSNTASMPGDPITALVPHSDDYLIISCATSMWRLRGDPAYGGSLDLLSPMVGVIGPNAWCIGPAGELVFLSLNGLYAVLPSGDSYPIPLSTETLPYEFRNVDPSTTTVSLEYDVVNNGIHVYLTPDSSNTQVHWWFDWSRKTYWPMTLTSDHEPTATCILQATAIEDSGVILGGRDGKLRRFNDMAENDCGTAFTSYAMMGPVALAPDGIVGILSSMDAVLSDDSGDVTWSIQPALTFEGTEAASSSDTGTWTAGLNATVYPACRGQAVIVKVTGTASRRWAFEQVIADVKEAGRRRIT